MYVLLKYVGGYFGVQADHVTESTSRPKNIKVLYKTRSSPIR
jgi:hypothetical protein